MDIYESPLDVEYRTLNCWECFEAQGMICHHREYKHELMVLQSGNRGDAICCKPGSTDFHCTREDLVCSMPAVTVDESSKYTPVATDGIFNYQMYAFCPAIDHVKCGISEEADNTDFQLSTTESRQTISTSEMRFREGNQYTREYDACHYMIKNGVDVNQVAVSSTRRLQEVEAEAEVEVEA